MSTHDGGVTRRHFLRVVTSTTLGAVAFTGAGGCKPPHQETVAQSRTLLAEDLLSAYDDWYATACRGCAAGCGVVVRVVEGRAKKVEGVPGHPVNQGKLCARGQALVQEQYHPDRIQGPLLRNGPRGSGAYLPISWADALERLTTRLQALNETGRAGAVALLTRPLAAHQSHLVQRFAEMIGARRLILDPLAEAPLHEAVRRVFGADRLPLFDLQNARYVLSFGADFLSTWLSPVQYGVGYGIFRQGQYDLAGFAPRAGTDRPRGYLVQIEPRFSTTAASADRWLPIRPGSEGILARALAQVIVAEGLAPIAGDGEGAAIDAFGDPGALGAFRPDLVAAEIGITAERIAELARDFANSQPALAIGGGPAGAQTNGTEILSDVYALNLLVGNVGRPGGVLLNSPSPLDGLPDADPPSRLADWQALAADLRAGRTEAVLVHDADPVHGLPAALGLREALLAAPFIASFSSFPDDTTALADLILPSHLPLEAWGITVPSPAPGHPVLTVQQPVVSPQFDTRAFEDTLLTLADRLGTTLPWASSRDLIRAAARELHRQQGGSGEGADFERFWVTLLQRGGWWEEPPPPDPHHAYHGAPYPHGPTAVERGSPPASPMLPPSPLRGRGAGGEGSAYPFHLVPFPHNTLGDGRTAHLPWLQAAPDPLTSVTWRSWVELNPRTAAELGVKEGDLVAVETPDGRAELPVYVSPAAPPDVLGIPLGQGHAGYGRWATGRGPNPLDLLAPLTDEATGALAYAATRARLVPLGRRMRLPKLEGTMPAYQLPDAEVLKVTHES